MATHSPTIPPETAVGRVALRVTELHRVADWYEQIVGLTVLEESEDRVVLGAGETPLLVLRAAPDAPERADDETGLFHVAVRVPSRAALGDALDRIEREWRLDGASDHLVSEALYLTDPEGNGVELYCDRPQREWPIDAEGNVEMETLSLDRGELRLLALGDERVPPGTTVGHVHLELSSLAAAREFYADGLGLNVRQELGDSALFLAAGEYHHHVGVNVWNGRSAPATGRGIEWFELIVPDPGALAPVRERLDRQGYETTPTDEGFEVSDPDGISVRLRAER